MCIFVLISQQKQWTKKNHFNFSILNTFCNEILAIPIVFALDAFCQCQTHLDPQVILIAKYNVFYSTRSNTRINTFGFVLLKILIQLISSDFNVLLKKQHPHFLLQHLHLPFYDYSIMVFVAINSSLVWFKPFKRSKSKI